MTSKGSGRRGVPVLECCGVGDRDLPFPVTHQNNISMSRQGGNTHIEINMAFVSIFIGMSITMNLHCEPASVIIC